MTPAERMLRSRLGGFALAAKKDSKIYTANARKSFLRKFELEVDPEMVLSIEERARRATAARRAYFAKLSLKSAQVRRKMKG